MLTKLAGLRMGVLVAGITMFFAGSALADNFAYMATGDGAFGNLDLDTGAFTLLGNSGTTLLGLGVANGALYAGADGGTLYSVDPLNGGLTFIGTAPGLLYYDFGSTTNGLYGIDFDTSNLYSVNPSNGAATLLGTTGIEFDDWSQLSVGSDGLYFANGHLLYSIDTTNGKATLIGDTGGPHIGALVSVNGILYGGENTVGCEGDCCTGECCQQCGVTSAAPIPGFRVDTLNTGNGLATIGPNVSGINDNFFALATITTSAPEPGTWVLMSSGILLLAALTRKRLRRHAQD